MMSPERLVHLHQCLCETKGFNYALTGAALFGNCCGILVVDLYHWPPVKAKPIYSKPRKKKMCMMDLFKEYKMFQLTKAVSQQNVETLADILSRLHIGTQTEQDLQKKLRDCQVLDSQQRS